MTLTDNARRRAASGLISVTMLLLVAFATGCEDGLTGMPGGEGERLDPDRKTAVSPIDAPLYSKGGNGLKKTSPARGGKPDSSPKGGGGGTDSTATDSTTTDSTATDGDAETPAEPVAVATVSVAPSSATVEKGTTRQFTAKLYDASGSELTGRTVSWVTSNSLVATVSSAGLVSALAAGSATITAKSEDKSGPAAVTVTNPTTTGPSNWINPGDDIQAKVNAHPAGTAFVLKAGIHREQQVVPKAGMSFSGEPGAVMSGARLLTSWSGSGPWSHAVTFASLGVAGSCRTGYEMCKDPNDIFIADKPMRQVSSLGAVGPGRFYNDRSNGRVYIGDNPSGKKVEFSVAPFAFRSGSRAHNVTIRNLVIEKYANKGQFPVIDPRHSTSGTASSSDFGANWIVENNVIRWNHAMGVRSWNGHIHRNNYIHDNGQLGLGGQGTDILIVDNEIARNGEWAGYATGFEAGGTKWTQTVRLTVRNNYSHHNYGPGLWTDINNIYTLYENNRVEYNAGAGIFHEISYDAVIRYNSVKWNSLESGRTSLRGSGIMITESPNVEIYGNEVIENWNGIGFIQQDRGSGPHGPYEVRNAWVHDNVIVNLPDRGYSGITGSSTKTWLWNGQGNNRFDRNRYKVSSSSSKAWSWNGVRSWSELRSAGQEPNGQVTQ